MRKNLCEVSNPKQWKTISSDMLTKDGYPVYGANGIIGYYTEYNHEYETLLITCRGATCGALNICQPYSYVNGNAMALDNLAKDIDIRYLYYYLTNRGLSDVITGSAQPQIVRQTLEKIFIEYPNIDIQKEIVSKLDFIEKLICFRKAQLIKLDELVKSRFIEMFGNPETNPKGYEKRKLASLAWKISDGVHAKPNYTETGRPFLSVVNINKGVINFDNCKFVSEEAYQKMIKSTHPERGDVLYTKVGATYGIPAYVDTDTEFCLYVSVSLIKPKHDEIDGKFLALSMGMPYVKRQADSRIKGIGVPDLHLNQISEFDIICPPQEEQQAFVSFVEQIDKSKLAVKQSLEILETLKKALMQKYFG